MAKLVITDIEGLDGEYFIDVNFTHRDFHVIKQVAGVRAAEVMDALEAGDLDIVVAVAELTLTKAGVSHDIDQLWDAPAGTITMELDAEEAEEADPTTSEPGPKTDEWSEPSTDSTNGGTDTSPETLHLLDSGTPPPVSSSAQTT